MFNHKLDLDICSYTNQHIMWPFKCTLIEVKTFKCGCTCVLTGAVDIIAQLPTICLLQVYHDVAIYISHYSQNCFQIQSQKGKFSKKI